MNGQNIQGNPGESGIQVKNVFQGGEESATDRLSKMKNKR